MKIITKALTDLSKDEYRACQSLTMRHNGMMYYSLSDNRKNPDAKAVMAYEGDKLIGWAILIPHGDELMWHSSSHQKRVSKYVTQFYVRKTKRRQGVGGRLMAEVNKLDARPTVIPHDPTSADFFASYDVTTERMRRGMITSAKVKKSKNAVPRTI